MRLPTFYLLIVGYCQRKAVTHVTAFQLMMGQVPAGKALSCQSTNKVATMHVASASSQKIVHNSHCVRAFVRVCARMRALVCVCV